MDNTLIHLLPDEGRAFQVLSDLITFKLVSAQTQNAFSLCHCHVPPGGEVHMHTQTGQETFILFEGELEFRTLRDGEVQTFSASRGSVVHVPEGVPHAYKNSSGAPALMFVLFVPGGAERFFQRLGVPVAGQAEAVEMAAPLAPPSEELGNLLQQYKVQLIDLPPS